MTIHDRIMSRYYAHKRETKRDPSQVTLGRLEAQQLAEEYIDDPSFDGSTYNGMRVTVTNKETFIDFA